MQQRIVGFTRDELGDWVAHLRCGHRQHVRHRPPFQDRAWVQDESGRASRIGTTLECPLCDRNEPPGPQAPAGADAPTTADAPTGTEAGGGDPACWAGLVCEECGAVVGPGSHRHGCRAGRPGP